MTASNPTGVLEDYALNAERLTDSFEEISPAKVYGPVAHLLPAHSSRFADIGAGTGRDAAWFAAQGHSVLAVEPTEYFRTAGMALHTLPQIEWLGDALPDLERTLARGEVFDRVILCAVWQHLRDEDRALAMPNLARLLAPGGLLIMSLRHGPDEPGSYPSRREDAEALARESGLRPVFAGETESVHPASRAQGVTWTWLALEQPMPRLKRLQWSIDIAAPASKVYQMLIGSEGYRQWTSAFGEGLYFDGSWQKGHRMRFLTTEGHGVVSEIAENRPNEFISVRHIGYIDDNGVEDTTSEAIRAWAPAFENYTFTATPQGTKLTVDQDITDDFEGMPEAWPKALGKLKALCESF